MQIGAITSYVDLAQIILYMFWLFFAGVIYYLIRENHREGYPMETDGMSRVAPQGWPIPSPKTFKLAGGGSVTVPDVNKGEPPIPLKRTGAAPDLPYEPTGNPMTDAVGPGAYALRADVPELDPHGSPVIRPLRAVKEYGVSGNDPDPRGMVVTGADGKAAGKVVDLWIDTCEMMFRYLEVELSQAGGAKRVLLPMTFSRITSAGVSVASIYAAQFTQVPGLKNPDLVTLLEEEKISAYYGAGTLYADPQRLEPLL